MTAWASSGEPASVGDNRGPTMGATPDHTPTVAAPFGLTGHPLRARVLGEIHSRPFQLTETPRTILQLAFTVEGGRFFRACAVARAGAGEAWRAAARP